MNQQIEVVRLGASVVVPVNVPGRKKPVKVHLLPGSGLPIIGLETHHGADYAVCLSSFGHVLINLYEDTYTKSPHTVAAVTAPSGVDIAEFIVENSTVYHKGVPHSIANEVQE